MTAKKKPTAKPKTKTAKPETISELWKKIESLLTGEVRNLSKTKHGHTAGNLTVSDIQQHLTYGCGIDAKVSAALASSSARSHELYRWTDEGKEEAKKAKK